MKVPDEHQEQVRLISWSKGNALLAFRELELLYAVPNGGKRNIKVASKLKAEGVRAGVPDLHLPVARGGFHSLYVEMKTVDKKPKRGGKGGVSDLQLWWHRKLTEQGHKVTVCYGANEAKAALTDYLAL